MKNKALNNMELTCSDEQAMLMDSANSFCRDHSDIATVRAGLNAAQAYPDGSWAQMAELGWLGVALPEEYGGSGLGIGAAVPLAEAMGRHLLATPFFSSTLAAQAILRAGDESCKKAYLPALAEGRRASLALLETSDWGDERITASAALTDTEATLSGSKRLVMDAEQAELFVVLLQIEGAAAFAIISSDQLVANSLTPNTLIDQTKRAATMQLDGVVIPRSQILTGDKVPVAVRDLRLLGSLLCAAEATGSCAAALDTIVDYLKTRKQFGKLIGSYQSLKHPTVEILNNMNSARSLIYHAATICGDAALNADAEIACRMAKAQATDALLFAGDRAVQFHGGMGFTYECDAQLYIRRAQWVQAFYGDSAHHRKRLAALLFDQ